MAKKDKETKQGLLLFTVAFDVEKSAISFVGNMPAAQAVELIQQVLQVQMIEQARQDVLTELAEKSKKKTKSKKP